MNKKIYPPDSDNFNPVKFLYWLTMGPYRYVNLYYMMLRDGDICKNVNLKSNNFSKQDLERNLYEAVKDVNLL